MRQNLEPPYFRYPVGPSNLDFAFLVTYFFTTAVECL
jgi:hypothetical protein